MTTKPTAKSDNTNLVKSSERQGRYKKHFTVTLLRTIEKQMLLGMARQLSYSPKSEEIPLCIQVMHDDLKRLGLDDADSERVEESFRIIFVEIGQWPTAYMIKENLPKKTMLRGRQPMPEHMRCAWQTEYRQCQLVGTMTENAKIGGQSGKEAGIYYCSWHYHRLIDPEISQDKREFMNYVDQRAVLTNMDKELLKQNLPVRSNVWRGDKEELWRGMMGFTNRHKLNEVKT